MFNRPPLRIDCSNLSQQMILDLADRLRLHFVDVDIFSDVIYASQPLSKFEYGKAWRILDSFNVNVT